MSIYITVVLIVAFYTKRHVLVFAQSQCSKMQINTVVSDYNWGKFKWASKPTLVRGLTMHKTFRQKLGNLTCYENLMTYVASL